MANPDDICGVCDTKRDEHGDMNHEFNLDGQLIPFKRGEPPKREAPRPAGGGVENRTPDSAQAFARLMDIMVRKEMLTASELVYIFGGVDHDPGLKSN